MLPWAFGPLKVRCVWSRVLRASRCRSSGPRGGRCPGGGDALGCRCLSGGPRGGRRLGGGGAAAFLVAPEGVAVPAVACRCLLVGPRGGRRAGAGVGPGSRSVAVGAPKSAMVASRGAGGAPKSAGGAAVCDLVPALAPLVAPKSFRWGRSGRRCLQTPCGAASPRPRGGLGRRSRGPLRRAPEGGWVVGPGRALRRSSEEVRGGSWGGCAAGGVASPKRGGVADCLGVSAPRGEWAHVGPQWRLVGRGQAPSRPVCRRASSFRRRASACIAGVIPLAGEEPSWLRRRGGAVRVRVRGAGAEAPSSRLRVRRGSARAEAPVSPLRGPLRGLSAPPRGVGVPGAECAVFPPGPRAGWSACVAEAPRVPTRCAVVRSCPRAGPSPCFAEARLGRHVPAHRGELGPGSAEAGPGCVRGCPWTLPLKVVRRSAWPSVSPLGPKPLPGAPCPWPRPGGGRGGESSRAAAASRSSGRGSLLPRGTRQGDGFRSEAGLVSLSLKGLWSRQRTTRRLCCR
jgi:hypothetical protein